MATPENTFIASVHRHLPAGLYSMKNHNIYNSGIADVWYSGPKADLWIEYKFIAVPKRPQTQVSIELSELQKAWLRARHAEGRNVGVLVGSKDGGVWFPGVSWDATYTAECFRLRLRDRKSLAAEIANVVVDLELLQV